MESRPKLELALNVLDDLGELQSLLREIVKSITARRDSGSRLYLKIETWLGPFINPEVQPTKVNRGWGVVSLVAEEGFEPPTQGL